MCYAKLFSVLLVLVSAIITIEGGEVLGDYLFQSRQFCITVELQV
uniref:Uncharacterized protein n=1 Tax=Candidatus Kentrum sp. MB TaxID=2138164 RepID=A0A450XP51_9GAMM|nr:MAG: hypothetical protein BECKMB1821G_GA0114241_102639 [Candidatus Kentron sp. MB]VFK31102.1 MAG: hypothetical protein BECKMB1821I_GA0114274_102039 [Candidatus Kentron sp. MB]VFK75521.1 MAG: hypothetical protein BECKMB1821H_GA0114242_102438 [Candidatus Kentron sp. MB]